MPAIQIAQLRIEINQLLRFRNDPELFVQALHGLFERYADRTRRTGQSGNPAPLINSYQVPIPVMKRVVRGLLPAISSDPNAGLALVDRLWQENWFEFQRLAGTLLGKISPHDPESIIERIRDWSMKSSDELILNTILGDGFARIKEEDQEMFTKVIHDWVLSADIERQYHGLIALSVLSKEASLDILPDLYSILSSVVRTPREAHYGLILEIVRELARRSPKETAFFLKRELMAPSTQELGMIIRQSLREFPSSIQLTLRDTLREKTFQVIEG